MNRFILLLFLFINNCSTNSMILIKIKSNDEARVDFLKQKVIKSKISNLDFVLSVYFMNLKLKQRTIHHQKFNNVNLPLYIFNKTKMSIRNNKISFNRLIRERITNEKIESWLYVVKQSEFDGVNQTLLIKILVRIEACKHKTLKEKIQNSVIWLLAIAPIALLFAIFLVIGKENKQEYHRVCFLQ